MIVRRPRWAFAITLRRGAITFGIRIGQHVGVRAIYFTQAARWRAEQERIAAVARIRALRMRLEAQLTSMLNE